MRKFTYLLIVIVWGLASCTQKGYKITGTIENAVDGDTVFIMKRVDRQFVSTDTAIIAKGEFAFAGVQDTAAIRYLTCMGADDLQPVYVDFFLENGNIQVKMMKKSTENVISGTRMNDTYQTFKNQLSEFRNKQKSLGEALQTATDEQKEKIMEDAEAIDNEIRSTIKTTIEQNINNQLGLYLIGSFYYYFEYSDLGEMLVEIPEQFQSEDIIVRLNELVEKAKATAVGQKFVDFEMNNPEGNPVKLSDYAGKGKLVLVDFWASWCGPCREEMPKLVEAYAKYKDKNFEIVGVSLDRSDDAWKNGLEQMKMTWPQMSDLSFWGSAGAKLYAVSSIPHVVLIDGEGVIISRGLYGEKLHEKLAELLD